METRNEFVFQYVVPNEETFLRFQKMAEDLETKTSKFEADKLKWNQNREAEWKRSKTLALLRDTEPINTYKQILNRNQEKWIYAYKITMTICVFCCSLFASFVITKIETGGVPESEYIKMTQEENKKEFYKMFVSFTLIFMFLFGFFFNAISGVFIDVARDYAINLDKTID